MEKIITTIKTEKISNENINGAFSPTTIIDFHEEYISLLIILFFSFGFVGYFFLVASKKLKKEIYESKALSEKYKTLWNLSIANFFRCISLMLIIIIENRTGDDIISFINLLCHIIPSLIFISILFSYIQFLIERYYELKTKKSNIYFSHSISFFSFVVYVAFFVITITCLTTGHFKTLFYIANGIIALLCFILGILYLYYGMKISNYYSTYNEIEEKCFINQRIMLIAVVVGGFYILRGGVTSLVAIGWFGKEYPTFFSINLWDFIVFSTTELLCSIVIGFSKKHKKKNTLFNEIDKYEFNQENYKGSGNINFGIDKGENALNQTNNNSITNLNRGNNFFELEDPLLEKYENEQ